MRLVVNRMVQFHRRCPTGALDRQRMLVAIRQLLVAGGLLSYTGKGGQCIECRQHIVKREENINIAQQPRPEIRPQPSCQMAAPLQENRLYADHIERLHNPFKLFQYSRVSVRVQIMSNRQPLEHLIFALSEFIWHKRPNGREQNARPCKEEWIVEVQFLSRAAGDHMPQTGLNLKK